MNIHDLNVFATAARMGSVTKAAKALATVQSNVTTRIRLLEDELGAKLFSRSHRGIELTHKGSELLPYAQQVVALVHKAKERVSGKERDPHGALRIGSLQSTAAARLPELLKIYALKFRNVDISVQTGTTSELIDSLLDGQVEGAFVSGLVDRPNLRVVPAFLEEVVVLTPAGYRTIKQYLDHGPVPKLLVFRAGCSYRQKLEHYMIDQGFDHFVEMEFGTLDGIIGCVGAGLGMAMLPKSVVERSTRRDDIRIHVLPRNLGLVETSFVTRNSDVRSSALERFVEVILEQRRGLNRTPRLLETTGARKSRK